MKRVLLLFISALLACAAFSVDAAKRGDKKLKPEKPDMEKIKKEVNDPSSKYYYPKLMKQFEANDTSMTLDQFRHLYLGYVFQEDYNPYRRSEYSSKMEDLYYRRKAHSRRV